MTSQPADHRSSVTPSHRVSPATPFVACTVAGLVVAAALLGCGQPSPPAPPRALDVPYADAAEVKGLLGEPGPPTLIEFCVPTGCFRCDEMRPAINRLAQAEAGRVHVRRVDLNAERELAAEWGVTMCPSYVVLSDGREVDRTAYPTSAGLIAAMIPLESAIE
ncbi:MAG: thioredoxin family protein [Planctomycetota bacterium]